MISLDFFRLYLERSRKNHRKDGSGERDTKEEPGLGRLPTSICGPLKIKQSTIDRFGYLCLCYSLIAETVVIWEEVTWWKKNFLPLSIKSRIPYAMQLWPVSQNMDMKKRINDIAVAAGISKASIFSILEINRHSTNICWLLRSSNKAYNTSALEETTDFFDRVWEASVMKVENRKSTRILRRLLQAWPRNQCLNWKEPYFQVNEKIYISLSFCMSRVIKFRHPEDAELVFQVLYLLAKGMSVQLENGWIMTAWWRVRNLELCWRTKLYGRNICHRWTRDCPKQAHQSNT